MLPPWLVTWLEDHRELVVAVFCLPASFLFSLLLALRTLLRRRDRDPQRHDLAVRAIQTKVQQWNRQPEKKRRLLCTSRPNWLSLSTTFFQKHLHHQVSIPLYEILSLDEEALTVRVEPMCTIGDITQYLIPKGYSLAVTIELTDATLGGLALGTGMSTHSHKAGLYHETVVSYDVVLGDGSLVTASKDSHPALYQALPWSHGSLGLLVALTIRIVKVKPFVKLTYIPVKGQANYCDMIREYSGAYKEKPEVFPDYIEGTIFSKDQAVVMIGEYSDYDPYIPVNSCSKWHKPWFYKHVETFLKNDEETVELIPLRDYLLRHNRAIFWVVEDMLSFGNNFWFRLLFGWLLPPKPAFLKWTTTPGVRTYTFTKQVFQDIVLPINELEKQIEIASELFEKFPLLVYPCKIIDRGPSSGQLKSPDKKYLVPGTNYAMYNDLGVYGVPGRVKENKPYNPVVAMRKMEEFTRQVGGYSFLYADIFMTREEFEQMFDLTLYEEVRRKYKAEGAFPHLYDKVKPEIDVFAIGEQNKIA